MTIDSIYVFFKTLSTNWSRSRLGRAVKLGVKRGSAIVVYALPILPDRGDSPDRVGVTPVSAFPDLGSGI